MEASIGLTAGQGQSLQTSRQFVGIRDRGLAGKPRTDDGYGFSFLDRRYLRNGLGQRRWKVLWNSLVGRQPEHSLSGGIGRYGNVVEPARQFVISNDYDLTVRLRQMYCGNSVGRGK